MPLAIQPHCPSTASDGHAPHPCSTVPRITAVAWQCRTSRSSTHAYSHASSIHCLPTAHASLPPHYAAHLHGSVTFCGGLPRGRGGKFEQVRARVRRAHWRGFLGQRTSCEGARIWCGEWVKTIQEEFQVGTCVQRICLQAILALTISLAPLALLRIAPLTLTLPFALTAYLFVAHTLAAPDQALAAALLAGTVTALVGLFCVGLVSDTYVLPITFWSLS